MSSESSDFANPIDLSIEAAIELEELKQGLRPRAPALEAFFDSIRTPGPAFEGKSLRMLDDVRAYTVFRDSLGAGARPAHTLKEFRDFIETYLSKLETGVSKGVQKDIEEAKRFCLSFNTQLMAKKMTELYDRRERDESRTFDHESIL